MSSPCIPGLFDVPSAPVPRPQSAQAQERERLNAAAERVLARLSDGRWHANSELCQPDCGGNRAIGARLPELRARGAREGWTIEKRHVEAGRYDYRLVRR